MQTAQGQLTILNAHTPAPQVFWNGALVPSISALTVRNGTVVLTVPEDPVLAEMVAAGIVIKRGVV